MIKLLFVCHGNICRSPMAEFIMKDLVDKAGLGDKFQIASAATSTEELGNPVYPPARKKLAEHGIGCEGKTARQLRREDYEDWDLLIGMDQANLRNMGRICGRDSEGKLRLLMSYAGQHRDVADPWYTGDFEAAWRDVLAGCQGLLRALERKGLLEAPAANRPLIEGCTDSYASCAAACAAGADRLELCANLSIGGTTPSPTLFRQVQRDFSVKINVLIRPRFGDFLYSEMELEEMRGEIENFRAMGANGVVIGVLTPEGALDEKRMRPLIRAAGGMEVTLHRAFDMTRDPGEALEAAVRLGCRTILTSGHARSALAGKDVLREVFRQAAGRLDIMAGGGVKPENILELHRHTGIRVFHTSARGPVIDSGMVYRKETVSMGLPSLSEYELWQTDEGVFRACAELVHGLPEV